MSDTYPELNAAVERLTPMLQQFAPGTGMLTVIYLTDTGENQTVWVQSPAPQPTGEASVEVNRLRVLLSQVEDMLRHSEHSSGPRAGLTNRMTLEILADATAREQGWLLADTASEQPQDDPCVQRITDLLSRVIGRERQLTNDGTLDHSYTGWWSEEDAEQRDEVDGVINILGDEEMRTGVSNLREMRFRARASRGL